MAVWKVISGKHYFNGHKYTTQRGNNVFERPAYMVRNFLDKLECIKPDPEPEGLDEKYNVPNLKIIKRPGRVGATGPKYNVVNEFSGKPINDIPLTKDEADAILRGENIPVTAEQVVESMKDDTIEEDDNSPEDGFPEDMAGE